MSITPQSIEYLVENRLNNSPEWHAAHKKEYETLVRRPLLALSAQLADTMLEIDPQLVVEPAKTISRVRRDTRFTKDKSFYRENMWIVFHRGKGMLWPTWFFEMTPRGYSYGVGYWNTPVPVRNKVAEWALQGDERYLAAQKALDGMPHVKLDGEKFKRKRYPDATEAQSNWVERKALSASHAGKDPGVLFAEDLGDLLAQEFYAMRPIYDFMAAAHLEVQDLIPKSRF